jgi:hypothetical protein
MLTSAILAELRAALDDPNDSTGTPPLAGLITEPNQLQTL